MIYETTDNRTTIKGFFFEADSLGKIHIYDNRDRKLIYYDIIDNIGSLPYEEFIFKCQEWLNENNI